MTQIYDRYDSAKNYERLRFRADRVLQSAELNELQDIQRERLRAVADVLFKEGDIIRGAQCITDNNTGATTVEGGALYVAGAVRGIAPAHLTVQTLGIRYVGAYLQTDTITELEDQSLYNPAAGTRGYGEPGAVRERLQLVWGVQGDGTRGTFYPVWTIIDGQVMPKEPPPNIDAVTQALERYDRDSAGGTYIVRGLDVIMGADLPGGQQVYTVREGAARVQGHALEMPASRRLVYDAKPDLQWVDSEPHTSSTEAAQRITFDRTPAIGTPQVRVQARKTASLTHGGFTGAADPLPDTAVLLVESVKQGATTYTQGADYKLTAGQIDWSPSGAEPAPGSTYSVTYQYMLVATPTDVDSTGFTVAGALPGTLVQASYHYAMRRHDRLLLQQDGSMTWVRGVPAPWAPKAPNVPDTALLLATVYQSWDASRRLDQDAVRAVPMQELKAYQDHIHAIYADLAELRLAVDISGRHSGVKKGLFADPMLDNSLRDAGQEQTAFIVGQRLQLPMDINVHQIGKNITAAQTTPYGAVPAISQNAKTGSMKVNPYLSFDPIPCRATLNPAVDYWTEVRDSLGGGDVVRIISGRSDTNKPETNGLLVSENKTELKTLREIDIQFEVDFPKGETLTKIVFDGIDVTPNPLQGGTLVAGDDGLRGKFRIPKGVPAGTKTVRFIGAGGALAETLFTGQGELLRRNLTNINLNLSDGISFTPIFVDPVAQTFVINEQMEICGVKLWFTDIGGADVLVQLRDVTSGVPGREVLAEAKIKASDIKKNGDATLLEWAPINCDTGKEYAIVVMCDDAITAVAIAELGKWDTTTLKYVTSQPYTVGVLLSSSNNSTWTTHQAVDMAFEVMAAKHTATERTIDLGSTNVTNATDLLVQAGSVLPSAEAGLVFSLQLADGSIHQAAAGQAVQLPARYSGSVQVHAKISGGERHAAQLLPGMQLVAASLKEIGTYITPAIKAGSGTALHVVLEAWLPAGASVTIQKQDLGSGSWENVPYVSSSPQTAGFMELTYRLAGLTADNVRVRVTLSGSHSARPLVANLRAIVL